MKSNSGTFKKESLQEYKRYISADVYITIEIGNVELQYQSNNRAIGKALTLKVCFHFEIADSQS